MNNPNNPKEAISIQPDTLALKEKARPEGLETIRERFAVQPDPKKAAELMISQIEEKRRALGIEAR